MTEPQVVHLGTIQLPEPSKETVLVMESFLIKPNGTTETGITTLWKSMEDIEAYFDKVRRGEDDRPFECRWKYIVVEKVPYGVYGHNEVVGWWEGIKQEGNPFGYDIVKLEKSPLDYADSCFNFTISG